MALDQQLTTYEEEEEGKEMTFLEHLEELRWHLIRSVAAIVILSIAVFIAKDVVWHSVILAPSRLDFWTYRTLCLAGEKLNSTALCIQELPFIIQNRKMTGQFTMHITSSFIIGLIVAFPYVFWEVWRFVSPGLRPRERRYSRGAVFFVSLLFMIGVLFGYYIISPLSVNFLSHYSVDSSIKNEFELSNYVTTISMIVLATALLFQLPIVVFFLSKAGLVTPGIMKHYRRHAIVVILTISALLTPPDPVSQILVAIPLFGLYQISIFISAAVKRQKELAEEA
ncbi:MAG: twin-arginine translocase subunit TatC [Cyclobacteriaceae bacterium]|nr:twin-arginine translocase subunit TatC [Cyclobacteriaceae bacterium]